MRRMHFDARMGVEAQRVNMRRAHRHAPESRDYATDPQRACQTYFAEVGSNAKMSFAAPQRIVPRPRPPRLRQTYRAAR